MQVDFTFSRKEGRCPSGKHSIFSSTPGWVLMLQGSDNSLSGWHCVLIATVHSSDAGLLVMAFLLLMFFCLKWRRHFNIQPLCPWLAVYCAGRWIQRWSITSQRLYLVWGHLGLFWAVVAVLCAIWVIVHIDPYAASNYLWACVGLCVAVCVLEVTFLCQFCWLDTDLLIALYG